VTWWGSQDINTTTQTVVRERTSKLGGVSKAAGSCVAVVCGDFLCNTVVATTADCPLRLALILHGFLVGDELFDHVQPPSLDFRGRLRDLNLDSSLEVIVQLFLQLANPLRVAHVHLV